MAVVILLLGVGAGGAASWGVTRQGAKAPPATVQKASSLERTRSYQPTAAEWASLAVEPVAEQRFRAEHITEGKIRINEDRSTPVFSPYSGRVTRLLAKAGDTIGRGQPLFVVEATDMVQAQNDFVAAAGSLVKARAALDFARITDKRCRDLFDAKAVPLKDVQQAHGALTAAETDLRSAETAVEAARHRLRGLGRTDAAIDDLAASGRIDPEMVVPSPLSGTVVQRKVGPGQYVAAGAAEPVLVVGDLSTVWLDAYVRETEAGTIEAGQPLRFTLPALPDREFDGTVDYVASTIDPASRRLLVRAAIDNPDGLLKPEMFADVTIVTKAMVVSPAVPREALVYEGSSARAWVVQNDQTIELRPVKTGMVKKRLVQITDGLEPGDRIVVKGGLLIGRVAAGS